MAELASPNNTRYSLLAQIIFFNSIPLVGVLFMHWDAKVLILAYFLETIVAVLFHAVRLWYVNYRWGGFSETKRRSEELAKSSNGSSFPAAILPIFMLVFFGFFCFVQLFVLGGFANKAFPGGIFYSLYHAAIGELAWAVASFAFLQLTRFVSEVIQEQYKFVPSEALLMQPFRRILVQQLTVILGGFFILLGGANSYVVVLVLVNIGIDLFFFFFQNEKFKKMITKNDPEALKNYEELKKMM